MSTPATITLGTLDPTFCAGTWQELAQAIIDAMTVTFPGDLSTFVFGAGPPAPEDTNKPWIRTVDGKPDKIYVYSGGLWISKHPLPPDTIALYAGAEANIPTFDGGANEALGAELASGPMWAKVTELNGKFPLGVSETHALASTGGEETHVLTYGELAKHTHDFETLTQPNLGSDRGIWVQLGNIGSTELTSVDTGSGGSYDALAKIADSGGSKSPADTAHNNMPPYYSLFFIKRTSRLYYRT